MSKSALQPEDLPELDTFDWNGDDLVEIRKRPRGFVDKGTGLLCVSGEEGDGFVDYYGEFRGGCPYINPKLEQWAKERGCYWEWRDAGSICLAEA